MKKMPKVWSEDSEKFYLRAVVRESPKLENWVYNLEIDQFGQFYLRKLEEKFEFPYKIYGLEKELVARVVKTYAHTTANLGILLNGLKGTGKTVTSKLMSMQLNQPVIVVSNFIPGSHFFLNSIPQNVTVFVDEYEKIYQEEGDLLTIMDGALNSEFRRVFILTTNKLYINDNLIQRPGRIRYLKTFSDLAPEITEEIVNDCLKHKQFKSDAIKFISNLEVITVDIVKSIIEEINIHEEAPNVFKNVFNVKKITGKYDVSRMDGKDEFISYKKNVQIQPRQFTEDVLGREFYIGNELVGTIVEVLGEKVIKVLNHTKDKGRKKLTLAKPRKRRSMSETDKTEDISEIIQMPVAELQVGSALVAGAPAETVSVFKVESADIMHRNYQFYY